jgi:nitronate monooxygenase
MQHAQRLLSNTPSLKGKNGTLPIGIGFINWGANLAASLPIITRYRPAAVWFFAPSSITSLAEWAQEMRKACPETKVWVQVGSVAEAMETVREARPDVLVVQGTDAGGHGLARGAGLISLLPEVGDAVAEYFGGSGSEGGGSDGGQRGKVKGTRPIVIAAGGISESRSASAAFLLGSSGVVIGTRLLATPQARISAGYRNEVLRASDGGQTTVRTKVYDSLRRTNWAESHNARGLVNKTFEDAVGGVSEEENRKLYEEEVNKGDEGWGVEGRMTTYAGSGVGLVRVVKEAGDVVKEIRDGVREILGGIGKTKL